MGRVAATVNRPGCSARGVRDNRFYKRGLMSEYLIEKHPHGWLLCATEGRTGVPVTAMAECRDTVGKNAVFVLGIAHHYNHSGHRLNYVVAAICTPATVGAWLNEIDDSLKDCEPQERWWWGTDVGTSSAAMFAALCDSGSMRLRAAQMGQGHVPCDADDFGRCKRLIDAFPEWRSRLDEVAAKYPNTAWPAIIARWDE